LHPKRKSRLPHMNESSAQHTTGTITPARAIRTRTDTMEPHAPLNPSYRWTYEGRSPQPSGQTLR
jgi:hypothetical protein